MRRALACGALASVALAGALVACAEARAPAPEGTGVRGRATIGPMCPVVREGEECPDRPVQTTLQIVARGTDDVVARVTSDDDGRFSAALAPGDYTIRLDPQAPPPGNMPQAVEVDFTVTAGAYADVLVAFDSGIR